MTSALGVASNEVAGREALAAGSAAMQRGDIDRAMGCFIEAVRLLPNAAESWLQLGLCRERRGEVSEAGIAYRRSLALAPRQAVAHFNLGNVLRQQGQLIEARAAFETADQLAPNTAEVLVNLGNVLRELGQNARAVPILEQAARLTPRPVEAQWNLALARLALGQLEAGWRGYEARWPRSNLTATRGLPWPLWRGEPVRGRRMLVWREQGLGDELLFATCLPDLIAAGADLTVEVDPRLEGLMARAFPEARVVPFGAAGNGPFDYHVPMGSLPAQFRRHRSAFRPRWSYLVPDRASIGRAARRLGGLPQGYRVGLCWRSGLRSSERARLYPDLSEFHPVLSIPGTTWVNLQYDDAEAELAAVEAATGTRVHRWPDLDLRDDLEGVAGLMWHLDLVITAPTAVGSLAGAIGVETWQVDPGTDWTCFGESRSPWFPAIQVMSRGSKETTWGGVLGRVADQLARAVSAGRGTYSNGSERR